MTLLDTIPPDDEIHNLRLDLLDLSGDGYYKSGKYSQADQRYRTALNIAQEIQAKPEQIAELCAELADTCEGEGRIDEVNEFVERGQRILQEHAETIAYSEIHVKLDWMYGVILWRKGEPKTVAEFLPKLITDAESLPQTVTLQYIIARIHNLFGSVLSGLCDYDAAIIHFQKAIKQLNEIGEKGLAAGYSVNLANTFKKIGRFDEGLRLVSEAFEISSQIGDFDDMLYAKVMKGELLLYWGNISGALQELEDIKRILEQNHLDEWWYISNIYINLALAYLLSTDLENASRYVKRGLAEAEKFGAAEDIAYAHDAFGQVETVEKHWEAAAQHFTQAIAIYEQMGYLRSIARCQYHFAEALLQQDKAEETEALLHKALKTFQDLKIEYEIVKVQELFTKAKKEEC